MSESCELVKICHINHSGPVFLRHSVHSDIIISIHAQWESHSGSTI